MIIALLMLLAGMLMNVFWYVLNLITIAVPSQLTDAVSYFLGYTLYLRGIFPIVELLTAIMFLLTVFGAKYFVELVIMLFNMIPGVNISLPHRNHIHKVGKTIPVNHAN